MESKTAEAPDEFWTAMTAKDEAAQNGLVRYLSDSFTQLSESTDTKGVIYRHWKMKPY